MKPISSCFAVILAFSMISGGAITARASTVATEPQTREASTAKVAQLLQQSGYTHRKTGDSTWVIERPGKKGWLLVAAGADFVVIGIIVATKKNMRASADLNLALLKLNYSLDFVKTGFDDDDDLFVRTEERTRLMDQQEFKSMVETVISAADTAYEEVRPFLITP